MLPDRLRLRDSKTGPHDVPLGTAVRQFLNDHKVGLPPRTRTGAAPVFPLVGGQHYEVVRLIWLSVRQDACLPFKLRIHDLRHSFASRAIMSGETLFCTSRILGHSRVQMTARYVHLADAALSDIAERLGRLLMP